jgi:hypothetical protein
MLFSSTGIQIFLQRQHLIRLRLFPIEGRYKDWLGGGFAPETVSAQFSLAQREIVAFSQFPIFLEFPIV